MKYPTRSVTAISGAPTPSIPESCPKCNLVDDGRGVVEGNIVVDKRHCNVGEDDDAAEGPPKWIGLVNVVAADDDDGQQNASTDNDIVAVTRSANAAATDAFLVMMMMCVCSCV